MSRPTAWVVMAAAWLAAAGHAAMADELALLDKPVTVTATFNALDEGGYTAQIGVHNGPITQLVHTVVRANSKSAAERLLRKQVQWRAPYLFVHSSCGGGRSLNCEGEALFKVVDGTVSRLGDLIGTAPAVHAQGHFLDVYDKLEGHLGFTVEPTPSFVIVLDDAGGKLAVNAAATWSSNADAWRTHAGQLASTQPSSTWSEMEWSQYFTALVSNAALARYCNKTNELVELLDTAVQALSPDQLRMVTDTTSKVVPLELPKVWRKPY